MLPVAFWVVTLFLFGIAIGSFLTAVIYRLARPGLGLSLLEPKRSMCPGCKHPLGPLDLLPLFSFLAFRQKCHYCKEPISWRYFGVELLTGLTFVALYFRFPLTPPNLAPQNAPTLIAALLFAATLIPIFFIDLETFHIPISLTLLATVIPIARDIWGIANHQDGFELLWGWMPHSILGGVIGALIFGLVRLAGWLYKGVEAMGLGDVFLARGMGAMFLIILPVSQTPLLYWQFPLWVILSCLSGIIVYPAFVIVRRQAERKENAKNPQKPRDRYGNTLAYGETTGEAQEEQEEKWEREGTLAEQLRDVGLVLIGYDAYEWARYTFDRKYRERVQVEEAQEAEKARLDGQEEWTPAPTAIPFGPFLVVGFLLTLFFGPAMIQAYLSYAHLTGDR